ncbi:hypothetical protein KR093_004493 [Drosophila rubida]|uniref:Uncharacterized protein n=1 Tax=Drosophila rubida TaxID=30044 RepID=A0AAD4JT45_9MUSC|nr:hypothetical protein KR093_004493 [Drosophila rubida]
MGITIAIIVVALVPPLFAGLSLSNQTQSLALQDNLVSRRVRALIFPNKASVLITAALTKIIVGDRPNGLQYSLEFDMYVPLPDTVEGWRPNILLGPTTKKPAAIKPKQRWDWHRYGDNGNYPYHRQRIHYEGPYQAGNYDSFYTSPWQLTEEPWQRHRLSNAEEEEVYASIAEVPSWKLHRGYRERREIFDQLEAMGKFFRLDFRSCIKRAMCELQARLNEHHKSSFLMEDLLRIVLTVPEDIADDKFRHRVEDRDCVRSYAISCPYPVLEFLTPNSRSK